MEIYESSVLQNDILTKKNPKKMHANLIKYQVENCSALPGRNLISTCNRRVKAVSAGRVKISSRQAGIMQSPPQFGYCPLVWMFHSREINRKINHIHERSLRIVSRDYNSSFKDLFKKNNSVCIHYRNILSP